MTRKYDNEGPTLRVRLRYAEEEIARLRSEREELLGALRELLTVDPSDPGHVTTLSVRAYAIRTLAKCEGRSTGEDATRAEGEGDDRG